jgi:Arylesterase
LVLVDYKESPPVVSTLSLDIPEASDFHPLGAALFREPYHSTLFVTNAGRNQSSIELFHVSHTIPPTLTWERSITHPLLPNANAILAVSPTQLYVTNDHRFRRIESLSKHIFETYSQLPLSYTTFLDFSDDNVIAHTAVSLQRLANGITATPDLETVFIAECGGGGFGVYTRTPDNVLNFKEHVSINGIIDNLDFVADGYVDKDNWGNSYVVAGAHPNVLLMQKDLANKENAPSWVVSARPAAQGLQSDPTDQGLYKAKNYKTTWHVKTELQDDGDWFSTSSGAMVDMDRGVMIGGGLYDENGAFICRKQ